MPPKLTPIVIRNASLSPHIRDIVGFPQPFHTNYPMTLLQLAGVDKLLELGARAVNHQSLDDQRAAAKKGIRPHSVTTSRLSRTISDAHIIFPIHPLSPLVHAANRIEAADMVQTLYERMVEELHHSKAIVSHEVRHHYPSDVSNVDLLQKTHPIFYVNVL
ncbi:MAG: hypothetical protein AABY11_00575, partial [archaeon]